MSGRYYKLEGHNAVPVTDVLEWGRWFETAERRVAHDEIGPFRISTVFLGFDHSFFDGDPLLFETMIFGPDGSDLDQWARPLLDMGSGRGDAQSGDSVGSRRAQLMTPQTQKTPPRSDPERRVCVRVRC